MNLKRIFIFFVLTPLVIFLWDCNLSRNLKSNLNDPDQLKMILNKCAEYCLKLNESSLSFVFKERIEEKKMFVPSREEINLRSDLWLAQTIPPQERPQKKGKNIYIFDHQFVRKDYTVIESRTLIEENGQKRFEKDVHLNTKPYAYEDVLFGVISLLSEFKQQDYNYKIVKEEKLKAEEATVIEVTPLTFQTSRIRYGKIWVKKSDFGILRIEWDQKSVENYEETEFIAASLEATPKLKLVAEYGYEKNGIRFPSKFSFKEIYILKHGRKYLRTNLTVIYRDYKFFIVQTQSKE